MPSVSAISVSVIPARSSSRYQSALLRANRDTSSANTIPDLAEPDLRRPARRTRTGPVTLAPETPRSSSITRTAARGQPSSTAPRDQVVLAGGGLAVAADLGHGGLAHIHHRGATQMRGGDLGLTHRRPPRCPSRAAALAITLASNVIAAAGRVGGQLLDRRCRRRCQHRIGARGRGRVWYQTELDRLHGSPPCTVTSLQPVPAGAGDQLADMQQIGQRPQRRDLAGAVAAGRLRVGPRGRDQRLAAVGQLQQQLHDPVPSHPTQHPQRPVLQRMTRSRDPSPTPAGPRGR